MTLNMRHNADQINGEGNEGGENLRSIFSI